MVVFLQKHINVFVNTNICVFSNGTARFGTLNNRDDRVYARTRINTAAYHRSTTQWVRIRWNKQWTIAVGRAIVLPRCDALYGVKQIWLGVVLFNELCNQPQWLTFCRARGSRPRWDTPSWCELFLDGCVMSGRCGSQCCTAVVHIMMYT